MHTSAIGDSDGSGIGLTDKTIGGIAGIVSALVKLNAADLQYGLYKHEVTLSDQLIVHSVLRKKRKESKHSSQCLHYQNRNIIPRILIRYWMILLN